MTSDQDCSIMLDVIREILIELTGCGRQIGYRTADRLSSGLDWQIDR
jgi:hypothetical protein